MAELVAGLSIGLAAGISPGPLQALIVTSTLRNGFGAGWRVAIAPLLTDVPIIVAAILAVGALPVTWAEVLGLVGGAVVIAFGTWEMRSAFRPIAVSEVGPTGRDVWRGVLVNALSPHPWVFWIAAGAPFLVGAWTADPWRGVAFVAGFYILLVGSKVALAAGVAMSRSRLSAAWRARLIFTGGALLVVGGTLLVARAA